MKRKLLINNILGSLSKDSSTKVSASLFNGNENLISLGYNGLPRGFNDEISISRDFNEVVINFKETFFNDDAVKELEDYHFHLQNNSLRIFYKNFFSNIFPKLGNQVNLYKYHLFEHAERNLIFNYIRSNIGLEENILLTHVVETAEDARAIVTSGIKHVAFYSLGKSLDSLIAEEDKMNNLCEIAHILYLFKQSNLNIIDLNLGLSPLDNTSNSKIQINKLMQFYQKFSLLPSQLEETINKEDFTIILKPDFSVLSLGFNEINTVIKNKLKYNLANLNNNEIQLITFSSIKNALYNLANNFIEEKNYKVVVSLMPCSLCSLALLSIGIKQVVFDNSSVVGNTTNKWQEEFDKTKKLFDYCDVKLMKI